MKFMRFPLDARLTWRAGLVIIYSLAQVSSLAEAAPVPTLAEKLAQQWALYSVAQAKAAERVGRLGLTIPRDEWESLLAPPTELQLSAVDLAQLSLNQQSAATALRKENENASVLDLQAVRQSARAAEFCAAMPKGGMLHVHPWGTLDEASVAKILDFTNALIKPSKLKEVLGDASAPQYLYPGEIDFLSSYADLTPYQSLSASDQRKLQSLFFMPERASGPYEFKRFAGTFALVSQLVFSNPQKDPAPLMWEAFFSRAQANRLRYVEISGNLPKAFALPKLPDWQRTYEQAYGVTGMQLGAFNRAGDVEKNRAAMKDLLALPESEVLLGINLVADETDHPMLESGQTVYAQLLAARAEGKSRLHAAVHAGELGDARNLRDAMILGSERLGHGVKLASDPVALQYAIEHKIAVEANLTSNVRLSSYPDVKTHPFLLFLRLGLRVSLATDDEGMFGIDLNHECVAAISETDINWTELRQLAVNSIDTSFAPDPLKAKLAADLESDLRLFEKTWK